MGVPLFTYDYLLLPMNSEAIDDELHWWLAVVKLRASDGRLAPTVTWPDSLPGPDERYTVALRYLRGYLQREYAERPASRPRDSPVALDVSNLDTSAMEIVPEQENGV